MISAVAGVALLGGLVAFAVLLPEREEDAAPAEPTGVTSEGSGSTGSIELPDELSGGLQAIDLGTLPSELAQQFGDPEQLVAQQDSISAGLEEIYDAAGAFRIYASVEGPSLVQVTVLDKAPGLFVEALPVDAEVLGVARPSSELVRVDDAVCSIAWGEDVPTGQPVDPDAAPQAVRCQLDAGGRTIEISTQGLSVEATTGLLDELDQDQ